MFNPTDRRLFRAALRELQSYKKEIGRGQYGRFIQVFLALKYFQNTLPSMFSNQFVSSEVLQSLLDDLYSKASRPLNDCVLILFEGTYLARTGLTAPGHAGAQNTWRNNLHLQKGIGCYAPAQDLSSPTFLNQSRSTCKYLQPGPDGTLEGGTCSLHPVGARYRREDHRKWLQIDPEGNGFAVVDLMRSDNFAPYVAPDGRRIPLMPLMVSLYHDALPGLEISERDECDTGDFLSDFNFSTTEAAMYFDDDPNNQHNRQLLRRFDSYSYSRIGRAPIRRRRLSGQLPQPTAGGTQVGPPGVNTGWDAEQYVILALREANWNVENVSRQQMGYDLVAQRGRQTRFVEVKSSLGNCSPSLTAREWQQAAAHKSNYILAILENFDSSGMNTIYWVPNPTVNCLGKSRDTVVYSIARSDWQAARVSLESI